MNWDAIGAIGEIIGAAAVLITLIAIYFQQRKIHALSRAENQRQILTSTRDLMEFVSVHPSALESIRQCLQNYDEASPQAQADFSNYSHAFVNLAEQAQYLYRDSLINKASYEGLENLALMLLATPGGSQWWQYGRVAFGTDIRDPLDKLLNSRKDDAVLLWDVLPYLKPTQD